MEFDRVQLRCRLQSLSEWKQLSFALAICERLFPSYVAFARETLWGTPEKIRECLNITWHRLNDRNPQIRLAEAAKACEAVAPDTEDFQSKYTSAALDAALSTANLMHLLNSFDLEKVLEIAESAYDTTYLFTFAVAEAGSIMTAGDKQRAIDDPLVQDELRNQKEDIDLLDRLDGAFTDHEEMFRERWIIQQ